MPTLLHVMTVLAKILELRETLDNQQRCNMLCITARANWSGAIFMVNFTPLSLFDLTAVLMVTTTVYQTILSQCSANAVQAVWTASNLSEAPILQLFHCSAACTLSVTYNGPFYKLYIVKSFNTKQAKAN